MDPTLDELYLTWLYGQVASVKRRAPNRRHLSLLAQLSDKTFVWLIPNDDNREAHGLELRYEFATETGLDISAMKEGECSMLEMLIAFSRVLAFEVEGEPRVWFWHMIEVLDLEQFNDKEYDHHACEVISEKLDRVIWRTYSPDGTGGLFPLRHPRQDQRQVELWDQASSYILENF